MEGTDRPKYYLSTRDLVTVAVLASLGGAMSVYVGYLGNLVNRMLGVPFGAGQFMAGLHVLWIILAIGITRKKGTGTLTGLVKGMVELFMGSTHGVAIVLVSLLQGAAADAVLFSDRTKENRGPVAYSTAGGLASALNVVVFWGLYLGGAPLVLMLMLMMLAFASGIIFGGWASLQIMGSLELSGMLVPTSRMGKKPGPSQRKKAATVAVTLVFLGSLTGGAVYYYFYIYVPPTKQGVDITGDLEHGFVFVYDVWEDKEVTIVAELEGSVTHIAPRNYTGVPLNLLIEEASPLEGATTVTVTAKDGYEVDFELADVMDDDEIIISLEDDNEYRIIAANYVGGCWVELVSNIDIH